MAITRRLSKVAALSIGILLPMGVGACSHSQSPSNGAAASGPASAIAALPGETTPEGLPAVLTGGWTHGDSGYHYAAHPATLHVDSYDPFHAVLTIPDYCVINLTQSERLHKGAYSGPDNTADSDVLALGNSNSTAAFCNDKWHIWYVVSPSPSRAMVSGVSLTDSKGGFLVRLGGLQDHDSW
jgi:hypothetical protein